MRLWYLSHRRPAKAQVSLHIRIWRMSLRRTKSAIISWAGSLHKYAVSNSNFNSWLGFVYVYNNVYLTFVTLQCWPEHHWRGQKIKSAARFKVMNTFLARQISSDHAYLCMNQNVFKFMVCMDEDRWLIRIITNRRVIVLLSPTFDCQHLVRAL